MWLTNNKYDFVDGYKVIRSKDKPWLCTTVNYWWEDLFGPPIWPRQFIDTKHPSWKEHLCKMSNKPSAKFIKELIKKNNAA
jgi:hypothetical protein